jgi:cysteine-rich repeat protein
MATVDNKTVCINQCGDGVITPPEEECDDQNTRNDDGCDQNCRVEKDFVCSSISPSACKLQYKASTLKHNYVYKVEEKNRCRFSFSLFPVHPVFQYLDWEKYLHLNISASSEYVMPGSVSYSYEASTQEIFV